MARNVIILGAGASVEAGVPLMNGFLDRAALLYRSGLVEDVKSDFKRVFDALSYLQVINAKSSIDLRNIESVFSSFEMAEMLIKEIVPEAVGTNSQVMESLAIVIARTVELSLKFRTRDKLEADGGYDTLAEMLRAMQEAGAIDSLAILTFNYDIAVEGALYSIRRDPAYYFPDKNQEPGFHLLKLHGSLNWAHCGKCAEDGKGADATPILIRNFPRNSWAFGVTNTENHLVITRHLGKCKKCDGALKPLIVPPTTGKATRQKAIQSVWEQAAKELSEAENLFIIGYSLPPTDVFFRFLYSIGAIGKNPLSRFWVFNPNKDHCERFGMLCGTAAKGVFLSLAKDRDLCEGLPYDELDFGSTIRAVWKALNEDEPRIAIPHEVVRFKTLR